MKRARRAMSAFGDAVVAMLERFAADARQTVTLREAAALDRTLAKMAGLGIRDEEAERYLDAAATMAAVGMTTEQVNAAARIAARGKATPGDVALLEGLA